MRQSDAVNRLEVPRGVFVEELRRMFKILGRRKAGEALLVQDVDRLLIRIGGAECALPAEGRWSGEARAASGLLRTIARVPPDQDPLVIAVRDGRLWIANSSTPCRWQPVGTATIEVPLNLNLREKLRLAYAHPPEALEQSGLASLVDDARAEVDKRIQAAAGHLAPLGVTATDLRLLVLARLTAAGLVPHQPW